VHHPSNPHLQHIALLGGEGMRPESSVLWQQLLALVGDAPRVAILPIALNNHDAVQAERRSQASLDALKLFGANADLISRDTSSLDANIVYLPGGDQRAVCDLLPPSAVWSAVCSPDSPVKLLIAAGGSAVALAEEAFAPVKPYPAALGDLSFERITGIGLIRSVAILPYFSWLQDEVIHRVAERIGSCALLGIDDQAALISSPDGWVVSGLGTVSIFRFGQSPAIFDQGAVISADVLSPYPGGSR
jgi:hypothetical protein